MNYEKIGKLIFDLRKEKQMTQKELADAMNLSDRTISKWERGIGCPDVSLLNNLSKILGVNIDKLLSGELDPNESDGGNMKRVKFYACPSCDNVLFSTGDAEISCCGRKLTPLTVKEQDDCHRLNVQEAEGDYYITSNHEMSKSHYLSFVACVSYDRVLLVKLYPEQAAELRFPKMYGARLYAYCSRDGLWKESI